MDLDSFLGHSSSARSGKVLNWKKRKPPQIDTWLHTKSSIIALWRHGFPRLVERQVNGEASLEVWSGNFNCWETEDVLKRQYKRDDAGTRVAPPVVCPMCLLLEHLQQGVLDGSLCWTDTVFEFEGDDKSQSKSLTVAGLYNGFGGDRLSRTEIAEIKAAGIKRADAWQQNAMAKCSYVFSIVDESEIEKGVQTAIETTALGDAVKKTIRDQIEALGATDGHPLKKPYVIRWQYKEHEQEFSKKYNALAMPKIEMSPEVYDLIVDSPAPDLGQTVARGNAIGLRAVMEKHAVIALPFDAIFGPSEKADGSRGSHAEPAERAARPAVAPARPAAAPARPAERPSAPEPVVTRRRAAPAAPAGPVEPERAPGTVTIPCDKCSAPMGEDEAVCWKCGAEYEIADAPAPAPKPKPKAAAPVREPGDDTDENDVGF